MSCTTIISRLYAARKSVTTATEKRTSARQSTFDQGRANLARMFQENVVIAAMYVDDPELRQPPNSDPRIGDDALHEHEQRRGLSAPGASSSL
jgi:hypothetical protein